MLNNQEHISDFALDFATIPLWLQVLAYVYFVGGIISAIYIAYDILKKRHMQKMPIMNVVWPITVFYLFPLGRWAYWHFGSYIFTYI